jgi:hypothetical protein
MTKRLTGRPPGRPCAVCGSANRAEIETAVRRGAPLRHMERTTGISARAIARHTEKCAKLPAAKPVRPAAEPLLLDDSGNIAVDAVGRPITRVNGHGGTSPTPEPPPRDFLRPQRWWEPTEPRPRMGDRCRACGGQSWWYVPGSHGGCCKCWGGPQFYGVRKNMFTT